MNTLTSDITRPSGFSAFLGYMPNPDVVLSKGGVRIDVFEEMLSDAHIAAKLEQLKDGALASAWNVIPADSTEEAAEIASFVKSALKSSAEFYREMEEILSAVEYGYSVTEVVWKKEGSYWLVDRLLNRKPSRFAFDGDGKLILADSGMKNRLNNEYKFIVHRYMPKNENPYGSPVLSRCYWPWIFKKAGFRFWLTVAEKFGVPTVLAMFNSIEGEETRRRAQALADSLYSIQNDAAVALANVDEVKVLESRGSSEDFAKLIEVCNAEISKAVTGEILTSDTGSSGSYALAKEHTKTFEAKAAKTASALAAALSGTVVKWLAELNFGHGCKVPSFVFENSENAGWEMIKDAVNLGMNVDLEEAARRFGIPLK